MKRISGSAAILALIASVISPMAGASLPDLAPPKIQLVDEFGVNVMNGQVQSSLDTVAIGGAMGLSHSISSYTNNFSMTNLRGYQDKYYAVGRVAVIDERSHKYQDVLRLHDISDSVDFELLVNGVPANINTQITSNFSYRVLGDDTNGSFGTGRHSLERRSDGVYWTKNDGTVVRFAGNNSGNPSDVGRMEQIKYPNGFTIDIDWIHNRITTNTGFALKYLFTGPTDNQMPAGKVIKMPTDLTAIQFTAEQWAQQNPQYIQAINTSVENCLTTTTTCTTAWPKAEFIWPAAMPRSIYIGDSTFKVKNAAGDVTEFYFRGFDLAFEGNILKPGHTAERDYSPRLIGIKPAGANQQVFRYTYDNVFGYVPGTDFGYGYLLSRSGKVLTAKLFSDRTSSYGINEFSGQGSVLHNSGNGNIRRVQPDSSNFLGTLYQVETLEGVITYEEGFRNLPIRYTKYSGMVEEFGYDNRGNIILHKRGATSASAEYEPNCDRNNFRYCNSPKWTRDGKGNQTDYIYHPESGQVAKVTYPPNKNNLRAETRYTYEPKYARYYHLSGVKTAANTPVWLKTEERYCINSNASGSGCAGNDEVVTRYEYEHDNLLLTGVTVTDRAGTTLRTCYQYDIYGNRIGETQPKADLSSCNQ